MKILNIVAPILTTIIAVVLIFLSRDTQKEPVLWVIAIIAVILTAIPGVLSKITEFSESKSVKRTIAPIIRGIIELSYTWFDVISTDARYPQLKFKTFKKEDLKKVLEKINPNGLSPLHSVNEQRTYKWTGFLLQLCLQTNEKIDSIFPHSSKVDAKLIQKLSKVKNSFLFKNMQIQANIQVGNNDLSYETEVIWNFFNEIREIEKDYESNLKKFDNGKVQTSMIPFIPSA